MNINLEELCLAVKGHILQKSETQDFTGVSIDSREPNLKGKIFFAIKGENFDGHDFLQQAVEGGATALVIHKESSKQKYHNGKTLSIAKSCLENTQLSNTRNKSLTKESKYQETIRSQGTKNTPIIIKVPDTLKALQNLAVYWRKKTGVLVIGITGSSGKTTTKHFCHTLLQKEKSTIASPKSFNNMYGVPLTLLSTREETDIVIQEIGMNQKGEIKALCQIAQPDIVTVTRIGESHIGMLGGKDAIAKEKEQIYINSPEAVKVFNGDDPYTKAMYEKYRSYGKGESLRFSALDETADVFLQIKKINKQSFLVRGHIQRVQGVASVPVVGPIHLSNLMSAICLALFAGLKPDQIWKRLSLCRLPAGRNQWVELSSGAWALFDAYNASPESVIALLEYFLSPIVEGKKILVLGDFLELGSYLETLQKKIAKKLVNNKELCLIWFIGSQAEGFAKALKLTGCSTECYCSTQFDLAIAKKILSNMSPSTVLAFKASRKAQLEKVLRQFQPLNFAL